MPINLLWATAVTCERCAITTLKVTAGNIVSHSNVKFDQAIILLVVTLGMTMSHFTQCAHLSATSAGEVFLSMLCSEKRDSANGKMIQNESKFGVMQTQ